MHITGFTLSWLKNCGTDYSSSWSQGLPNLGQSLHSVSKHVTDEERG